MIVILGCALVTIIYAVGSGILALLLSRVAEIFGWLFMIVATLIFAWILVNVILGIRVEEEGEYDDTI